MITIHLDEHQADKLARLIGDDCDFQDITEQIRDAIEREQNTRFCNTDCIHYRRGTCPFKSWEQCPKYNNKNQEQDSPHRQTS